MLFKAPKHEKSFLITLLRVGGIHQMEIYFNVEEKHFLTTRNQYVIFGTIGEGVIQRGMYLHTGSNEGKFKIQNVELATSKNRGLIGLLIAPDDNNMIDIVRKGETLFISSD